MKPSSFNSELQILPILLPIKLKSSFNALFFLLNSLLATRQSAIQLPLVIHLLQCTYLTFPFIHNGIILEVHFVGLKRRLPQRWQSRDRIPFWFCVGLKTNIVTFAAFSRFGIGLAADVDTNICLHLINMGGPLGWWFL